MSLRRLVVVFVLFFFLAPRVARADSACASDWRKRVYFSARDSIVRVEPIGMSIEGLMPMGGFVYATRSHVVVPSEAVGVGRGARVVFAGGRVVEAHAVAVDEAEGIAILALDAEAPAPPLEVADAPLGVGDEVAAVAAFEANATLDAWVQTGHVANAGDRTALRFDGAPALLRGAPVFACDGKIVALRRGDVLVPGAKIRAVATPPTPFDEKRWSLLHAHAGFLVQGDAGRAYLGGSFGLSAVHADRLQLRLGLGVLGGLPREAEVAGVDRVSIARLQVEPTIGYRILLTKAAPLYLVPEVGGVGRVDFIDRTHASFATTSPACFSGPGPCDLDQTVSTTSKTSLSASPVLGLSFLAFLGGVSYHWQIDVGDPRRSTHQVFFGLEF
jgi:hypothetical protein